jgi:hypothetical protein
MPAFFVLPSLRATGSRERAPDDRLREAIHQAIKKESLDCFVASLLAMTKSAHARGAQRT